jgi:hypothetical protein
MLQIVAKIVSWNEIFPPQNRSATALGFASYAQKQLLVAESRALAGTQSDLTAILLRGKTERISGQRLLISFQ